MQPTAVARVCTDTSNHMYGQDKSPTTYNSALIRPTDQSSTVASFHVTNNFTKSTTHHLCEHNSSSRADQTASQPLVSSLSGNFNNSIKSGHFVFL